MIFLSFVLVMSYAAHVYATRKHAAIDLRAEARVAALEKAD